MHNIIIITCVQRPLLKGGRGGTCPPNIWEGGDKILFVRPKFMANSRTLSLLFEFAADVFSEIIM